METAIPTAPEGYHTLNPILRVADAAAALAFYQGAFGAVEDFRREAEGRLLVAVVLIGDSRVMLWDASNDPAKATGGGPHGGGIELKIYVDDVDAAFRRAVARGARADEAVETRYFGERSGSVVDPFGFTWRLAQFLEEVPHAAIERRMHEDLGR